MKALLVLALTLMGADTARAQDDYFDFIPAGGRLMTEAMLAADPAVASLLAQAMTAPDWLARMADLPGGATLDEWQRQTLADYLAYAGGIADPALLPPDGRDMALERCQSCHIITVTVTQARSREAWLGTLYRTSHVEIPLSDAERGQLADYLTVNAGLPIDAIPLELRAGGASY